MLKRYIMFAVWCVLILMYYLFTANAASTILLFFTIFSMVLFFVQKKIAKKKNSKTIEKLDETVQENGNELSKNNDKTVKKTVFNKFKSVKSLVKLFIAEALTVTVVLLITSLLGINCKLLPVILIGMFFAFIVWLEWGRKSVIYAIVLGIFGFILIGFIMKNPFAINSVCIVWNTIADTLGKASSISLGRFVTDVAEAGYPLYSTYLMCMGAALFGVIAYLAVSHKQRFFIYLFCAFAAVVVIGFRVEPNPLYTALFALVFVIITLFHWYDRVDLNGLFLAILLLVIMGGSYVLGIQVDFATKNYDSAYEVVREKYLYDENVADSYGNGKIAGNDLYISGNTALRVTMSEPRPMYLRGFTGASFDGSKWNELDNAGVYDSRELFYLLNKNGYDVYSQLYKFNTIINPQMQLSEVNVEFAGSGNKYVYLPYEAATVTSGEVEYVADRSIVNVNSVKSYSFYTATSLYTKMFVLRSENEDKLTGDDYSVFDVCEDNYYEYVKENYLAVSESDRKIIEEVFKRNDISVDTEIVKDNEKIAGQIRSVLSSELTYNEDVVISIYDNAVVNTVLNEKKEGYDIHYATIATLMFRLMGVPSRYVEGYIVPITESVKMNADEVYNLNSKYAHAWVEIYINDVGWAPIEVCDDYYSMMFSTAENVVNNPPETVPHDTSSSKDKVQTGGEVSLIGYIWICVIAVLAVVLVFFAVVFIRRTIIIKKRQAAFADADYKKAVSAYFSYFEKVLKYCGYNKSGENFEDIVGSYMNFLSEEEKKPVEKLVSIYNRAVVSENKIKKKDLLFVGEQVGKIIDDLTDKQSVIKNIVLYMFVCV